MSFAIMDEKQCSDRALETICVQDLPAFPKLAIDIVLEVDAFVRASTIKR